MTNYVQELHIMKNGKWFYIYASLYALKYHNSRLDWLIQIFHTEKRTNADKRQKSLQEFSILRSQQFIQSVDCSHCYFSTNLTNHCTFLWVSPVIAVLHSKCQHHQRPGMTIYWCALQHIEHCGVTQMKVSDGQTSFNERIAGTPYIYLESMSLRSGLGLEVGVISSLDGKAVRSSRGLGVLVQFCQGFCVAGPEDDGSLSGVERWLWKGSVCVSSSRGTPTIRSCLRRGRRPCVDWLRGLEPRGGFPWLPVEDGASIGDSSASKPVLS